MDEHIEVEKMDLFKDTSYKDRTKINLGLADKFEPQYISEQQISEQKHIERLDTKYQLLNNDRVVEICQHNNEQTALSDKDHKDLRKEREKSIKSEHKEFVNSPQQMIDSHYGIVVRYDSTIIEKFTRDYVGNNYKAARQEIENILKLDELYKEGQTLYMVDKEGRQIPIDYDFTEFAQCCQAAFLSALEANGLKYSKDGKSDFEIVQVSEQKNALNKNTDDVKAIQRIFQEVEYNKEVKYVDSLISDAENKLKTDLLETEYEALLERNILENPLTNIDVLKTENEANYTANKKLIDTLYDETDKIFKSLVKEHFSIEYLNAHRSDLDANFDLDKHIEDRIQGAYKKIHKLNSEINNLTDIMQLKLQEIELGDVHKEVLTSKYMMHDAEFEVDIKELCNKYSENDYNSSAITDVKDSLEKLCYKLKGDLSRLELVNMHEEICALAKEVTANSSVFTTGIEKLQVQKLLSFANKSRAAVLLTGCKRRSIELADLTAGERAYIKRTMNSEEESENLILAYAKELYNKSELKYYEAEKAFMSDNKNFENVGEILNKKMEPLPTNHQDFTNRYLEKISPKAKQRETYFNLDVSTATNSEQAKFYQKVNEQKLTVGEYSKINVDDKIYYQQNKERVQVLKSQMQKSNDIMFKMKLQKQIDVLLKEMSYYQMKKRLHDEKYCVYGMEAKTSDYLLRSVDGFDNVFTYSQIPEEEMYQMMKKLSAGAYEEEEANVEIRESYKAQNMEGVAMYKGYMMKRFKWLYEKYGTKCPDVTFVYKNMAEINRDFATGQSDDCFLMQQGVLDENKIEDVLLKKLSYFYFGMSKMVQIAIGINTNSSIEKDYHDFIKIQWQKNNFGETASFIRAHEKFLKNID